MTDLTLSHTAAKGGFFSTLIARLRDAHAANATRKALHKLSDRELDDIGIVRADIDTLSGFSR